MDFEEIRMSSDSNKEGTALVTRGYSSKSALFKANIRKPLIRKFLVSIPLNKFEYIAGIQS